jgi:hypothetical protein
MEIHYMDVSFVMTIISVRGGHYDYSPQAPSNLPVPLIVFIVLPKTAATDGLY